MPNSNKNIITLFNHWAENGRSDQMAQGHRIAVMEMFNILDANNTFSFLEIGCGNGWATRVASENMGCKHAVGIDISDKMIDLANQRITSLKQQFICADFNEYESKDKFDIIFSMEVFYYIYPIQKALEKVLSLLKPNGTIIVGMDYYRENEESHGWPLMVGLDMELNSINEWKELFIKVGFRNLDIYCVKDEASNEVWKKIKGTLVIRANK